MNLVQLIVIGVVAAACAWAGWRVGRTRFWAAGFIVALLPVILIILGHRSVRLSFWPPIAWATDVRITPFLMAAAIPVMLVTLLARLPRGRRGAVVWVTAMMVGYYSVLPIVCPWWVQSRLAAGATRFDRHGVCLQTQAYTCGPAAAVTCLRALGVMAEEGSLAVAARCGPAVGTDERELARVLDGMLQPVGMRSASHYFASLDELTTPAIANMNMPLIGGHYVAVLAVETNQVVVGDPYSVFARVPRGEFLASWNNSAITFDPAKR